MARLLTAGAETQHLNDISVDGTTTTGAVIDNTFARSGQASYKCTTTSALTRHVRTVAQSAIALNTTGYARGYFYLRSYPSVTTEIMCFTNQANTVDYLRAKVDTTGHLLLFNAVTGLQIGLTATNALALNTWYRIEMSMLVPTTGATGHAELRYALGDSTSVTTVATSTLESFGATPTLWDRTYYGIGAGSNTAAIWDLSVDDIAVNDSTGTNQNGYPGPGKIVMLKPISDSSLTGWKAGLSGTTNLWDAVNNFPPAGKATASQTTTSQISDATSSTTDNYVANLAAYSDPVASGGGGIGSGDTIALIQTCMNRGQNSTTAGNIGQSLTGNPVLTETIHTGGTTAIGTYPTGWLQNAGGILYLPTVTLGTSPTMKIRKNTASTVSQAVDQMGLIVEYIPGGTVTPISATTALTLTAVLGARAISKAALSVSLTLAAVIAKQLFGAYTVALSLAVAMGKAFVRALSTALSLAASFTKALSLVRAAALALSALRGPRALQKVPMTAAVTLGSAIAKGSIALRSFATGLTLAVSGRIDMGLDVLRRITGASVVKKVVQFIFDD